MSKCHFIVGHIRASRHSDVNLSNLFVGRFERYLDFVISLRQLYGLPQSATAAEKRAILAAVNAKYFTCLAKERLAVTSQVRETYLDN